MGDVCNEERLAKTKKWIKTILRFVLGILALNNKDRQLLNKSIGCAIIIMLEKVAWKQDNKRTV